MVAAAESALLAQAILDSTHSHIVIVDREGKIILTNQAWDNFARNNGDSDLTACGIGVNYFDVCRRATAKDQQDAQDVLTGAQAVLSGQQDSYELIYPCHSPTEQRWFAVRILPLQLGTARGIIIAHHNVTKMHELLDIHHNQATFNTPTTDKPDLSLLDLLYLAAPTPVTSRSFGIVSLEESHSTLFAELTQRYVQLLDASFEAQTYYVKVTQRDRLQQLAEQLGLLRCGPRDVINLHRAALQAKNSAQLSDRVAQAYETEGRLVVLELMGYLLLFYRRNMIDNPLPPITTEQQLKQEEKL